VEGEELHCLRQQQPSGQTRVDQQQPFRGATSPRV